jgi:hypothetical protein
LVVNHSVAAGSSIGVRWYEVRAPNGNPIVFQQSTFAPDATSRFMGSVAMDRVGNLAVGYSASSSSMNPALRYAGRLVGDPANQLTQGEGTLIAGGGSQTTYGGGALNRWGDYSSMSVDPSDDCTFWYTNEYLATSGVFNWQTRIGSFKFPSCGVPVANVSPASLNLGTVTVGTASPSQNITIGNTGLGTLVISNITLSGANPGEFGFTSGALPITVPPGSNVVATARFQPGAVGARSASLDIVNNSTAGTAHVALTGNGVCTPGPCPFSPNPTFQNHPQADALDGNLSTYWQPTAGPAPFGTDPKTLQFVLPSATTLTSLRLRYYSSGYRFIDYTIATSPDASFWTTVATITGNTLGDRTDALNTTTARYLRVIATRWAGDSGAAYGPAILEATWNAPLPVTASSPDPTYQNHPPADALDGKLSTYWQPTAGPGPFGTDPKTLQIDLGTPTSLTSLRLRYYSSGYRFIDYTIATSPDAGTWTTVATVTGNTSGDRTDTLTATSARYLRVTATSWASDSGAAYGPAILEASWS